MKRKIIIYIQPDRSRARLIRAVKAVYGFYYIGILSHGMLSVTASLILEHFDTDYTEDKKLKNIIDLGGGWDRGSMLCPA